MPRSSTMGVNWLCSLDTRLGHDRSTRGRDGHWLGLLTGMLAVSSWSLRQLQFISICGRNARAEAQRGQLCSILTCGDQGCSWPIGEAAPTPGSRGCCTHSAQQEHMEPSALTATSCSITTSRPLLPGAPSPPSSPRHPTLQQRVSRKPPPLPL